MPARPTGSGFAMELTEFAQNRREQYASASERETLGGRVSLFLRLWSYGGPSQPPSGLALEQDPEITQLIRSIIRDGKGAIAQRQPELLSAPLRPSFYSPPACQ